jgi:hypothetical protein
MEMKKLGKKVLTATSKVLKAVFVPTDAQARSIARRSGYTIQNPGEPKITHKRVGRYSIAVVEKTPLQKKMQERKQQEKTNTTKKVTSTSNKEKNVTKSM